MKKIISILLAAVFIMSLWSAAFADGPIKVDKPTAVPNLVYTGAEQTGVQEGTGYTVTNNKGTAAGSYTATATLADGYIWSDDTSDPHDISWEIAKASVEIPTATDYPYDGNDHTGVSVPADAKYEVSGDNVKKDIGSYDVTAALKDKENYLWSDGSAEDKKLTWHIKQVYEITITDDGNGTLTVDAQDNKAVEGTEITCTITPKSGYELDECRFTPAGIILNNNQFNMPESDVTINVTFKELPTYTVSFNSNGGTNVSPQTVEKDSKASEPTAPQKTGYEFDGWFRDENLQNRYDFNTPVTENITLYAKWKALPTYTVSFNSNGGTNVTSQSVEKGSKASAPAAPQKTGYEFDGWFRDENLQNRYDFNTPVTENITLYAKWKALPQYKVTLTYTSGGSAYFTANKSTTITVTEGSTVQVSAAASGNGMYVYDVWVNGGQNRVYGSGTTSITYESPAIMKDTVIKVRFGDKYGNPMTGDAGVWQYVAAMLAASGAGTGIVLGSKKRK